MTAYCFYMFELTKHNSNVLIYMYVLHSWRNIVFMHKVDIWFSRCGFPTFTETCEDQGCGNNGNVIGIRKVYSGTNQECSDNDDITVQIAENTEQDCFINANEWGFSLQINANPDHVYNPRRQIVLQLQTTEGDYSDFWADYELPRATVRKWSFIFTI